MNKEKSIKVIPEIGAKQYPLELVQISLDGDLLLLQRKTGDEYSVQSQTKS